jgi:hypothetical protein
MLASLIRFFERVSLALRQFICSLHGHDALLHFEHGRMSLLCSSCGHETPGWDVRGVPGHHHAMAPQARVMRMPLVRHRAA